MSGVVPLRVTSTPVQKMSGLLDRNDPIAVHELVVDEAIVLIEDVGRRAMGARAGAVLSAVPISANADGGELRKVYCDLSQFRAFHGANIFCFEDTDHDGRLEERWVATSAGDPSFVFRFVARSGVDPAAFRAAALTERPTFGLALDACRIGRAPTFRWTLSNNDYEWNAGTVSGCPYRGQDGVVHAGDIRVSYMPEEDRIRFAVERTIPVAQQVVLYPSAGQRE